MPARLGQEIQYDDIGFTALDATRTTLQSDDVFTVTLPVTNHARSVDFYFDRAYSILTDDTGVAYQVQVPNATG